MQKFLPDLFGSESYTLSQPNPPLPDVIVQLSDRRIGIEITTLVVDKKLVQRESSQKSILSEAQRIFEQQYQLPLNVAVSFVDGASWKKRDCEQVSIFLADAVSKLVLEVKDLPQYRIKFDAVKEDVAHTHVTGIGVSYLKQVTNPCWCSHEGFYVPDVSFENIEKIIKKKNKNVSGYMLDCDEVWLLIIETGAQSSYFDHFEDVQSHVFESIFKKIMIGRYSKGSLLTIRVQSAA